VLLACAEGAPREREEALRKRGAEVVRLPAPGGRVSLAELLDRLHERGKLRVLIEGGGTLLGAAFDSKRVDEVRIFVAPKIIGGKGAPAAVAGRGIPRMSKALDVGRMLWEPIGPDILLSGRVGDWDWMD
jgi:diaminohydroxyphosphoribosylaminopyrimidine deaminase/5-amino-6-(5-phosphoribosylamino)uracil reductase